MNLKLNIRRSCGFECVCVCMCFYVSSAVTFWPASDSSTLVFWVCACVLLCVQCSDILTSDWLLCVCRSLHELHPPGGDRIGHTEWLTFHLPAPPQCPQVVPLCHRDEGRWMCFTWKISLWGVKDYLRATFQAELICVSEHKWGGWDISWKALIAVQCDFRITQIHSYIISVF